MQQFFIQELDEAIRFAAEAHHGQMRKTDLKLPYISHPVIVGFILLNAGFAMPVVIAGILHDTVEDTEATFEDIEKKFGSEITQMVREVSEDKGLPYDQRKAQYITHLVSASEGAKAIATADKIHNVQGILGDLKAGKDIWDHFKKGKAGTVEYYEKCLAALQNSWQHPLLDEYNRIIGELKQLSQD